MKQALHLALLEGIAIPGIGAKLAPAFESGARPILINAAEIAAAMAVSAQRAKRGGK